MPYTNTIVTTSTSGTWNGTSISYNSISLIDGIPHSAQLEVERVFITPRDTTNYSTIEDFLNNPATTQKDKQQVFVIPASRITFNETNKTITAINLPNDGASVYNFDPDGDGLANVPVPGIVAGAIGAGDIIKIRRKTVSNQTLVEWSAGSKLTSAQLNLEVKQLIYLIQELIDKTTTEVSVSNTAIGTIPNYSITPTKLSTGGPSWTSGGSVGIGTASPSQKLHVYGSGATIRVDNTNLTSGGLSLIATGGPSGSGSNLQVLHETGNSLVLLNSGSPGGNFSFRGSGGTSAAITQTGTLVIGSGTINTNASFPNGLKLETVTDSTDCAVGLYHYGTTEAGNAIRSFRARGSKTSPTAVTSNNLLGSIRGLGYNGSAFTAQTGGMDIITTENWTTGANGTAIVFNTTTNGSSASSLAERMRIDHSGNVGIGTGSPATKLHVVGSSTTIENLTLTNSNSTSYFTSMIAGSTGIPGSGVPANSVWIEGQSTASNTYVSSYTNNLVFTTSARTERMRINSSGALIHGATTTGSVGAISLVPGGSSPFINKLVFGTDDTGYKFAIASQNGANAAVNRLVICDANNAGNVGIGTDSPLTKLQINVPSTGTTLTGTSRYGGIHLSQNNTNDEFVGITAAINNNGTQGGILFQSAGNYGTKLHFLTTNNFGTGMQNRMTIDHTGNVSISSSTGATAYDTAALTVTGGIGTGSGIVALSEIKTMATSNPMASAATTGIPAVLMYSNSIGIYAGDGQPAFTAAKGSLYIRLTGAAKDARLYINTTGAAVWATVTTSA